ncbi:MAG TPA: polyprenol phosphomannose-dependent alpha 1,6 mannosyltransferase MptB [Acidimicrobiales bacterium]
METSASTTPVRRSVGPIQLWIAVGVLGSVGMVLSGSAIGSVPQPAVDHWWFTVPVGTGLGAHVAFYASIVVLLAGWAGVGAHAYRGRLSVRTAWVILALWGLPLFLGAPLFSRDLYSYVAQGQLARHGLNPYVVAPSALGPGNLLSSIASVWRNTASPYGPLFVSVSHLGASVSGGSLVSQILVFRAVELVGVALLMVSLPVLARRLGNDPGLALWLAVLSPLALFSFVSSGHNDALMLGLMLAGITLGTGGRLRWGVALCALAATIKLPAAAGIGFLVAAECTRIERSQRWRTIAEAAGITVLVVAGVTVGAGLGWTWLGPTALRVPTELRVLITPLVSVGTFVHGVLHAVGIPVGLSATVTVVQAVGGVAAVSGILWMLVHTRGRDAVRLCGVALILFVVLSPTLWPWYLMWGVAVLAATSAQRSRALAAVAGLAMLVVGAGGTPMFNGGAYWLTGPILLAGLAWFLWSGRAASMLRGPTYAA